jgi:hypothetical protein
MDPRLLFLSPYLRSRRPDQPPEYRVGRGFSAAWL